MTKLPTDSLVGSRVPKFAHISHDLVAVNGTRWVWPPQQTRSHMMNQLEAGKLSNQNGLPNRLIISRDGLENVLFARDACDFRKIGKLFQTIEHEQILQ